MNGMLDITEFGVIIVECKVCLLSNPSLSVVFGWRVFNGFAHTLARRSIMLTGTVTGVVPPKWLTVDLANICFVDYH
ncbi:hypothetical protein LINGRAPRIM_LOCUS2495 [Linum grandiflorum]